MPADAPADTTVRLAVAWRLVYGAIGMAGLILSLVAFFTRRQIDTVSLISFAAFCGLSLAVALLPERLHERLRMTPRGLEGRLLRGRVIPWTAIDRAGQGRSMLEPYLCIWLREPDKYRDWGAGDRIWRLRHRRSKFGDVVFNFAFLTPSARLFAEEINRRARQALGGAV